MSAVYKAIAAVQGELAKVGISKNGQNTQQNYRFRGIDQVYGALSPLLAKHGLCVLPRIIEREMHERVTVKEWNGQKKESVLFYVTVTAEFDFVSVEDGSTHTVRTYGEAMDSGDKATNKAMSAAYKYAAFMAFAIPTEGDNDADATTHDVAPRQAKQEPQRKAKPTAGITEQQLDEMKALIPNQTALTTQIIVEGWNVSALTELTAEQAAKTINRLKAECRKAAPQRDEILADEIPY
ncbi:ERF superfamily protein [Blastomonas natatoria]|uniref:ERF superfamily protein n=1 Tax=Blastomonas natatoria TaxID=34015 RepID=A0A2V3V2D3_9SPHN|nr:ERF family protein [Blastomonas natatoria]PXW75946.1 ERF superfamily protein [Blastomonas natatoria]